MIHFPIDILFLNKEGKIIGKQTGAKPEKTFGHMYQSPDNCKYVIELNAGEIEDDKLQKSNYSRSECMEGKHFPTVEILWAEGMAHAWFCDKHFEEFKKKHSGEVSSERKLKYGVASKHWKDGVPTKEKSLEYLQKSDNDYFTSSEKEFNEFIGSIHLV